MTDYTGPAAVLRHYLDDPATGWSIGAFGALAEFARADGEPVERRQGDGWASLVSPLGALRVSLDDRMRLVPYEAVSRMRTAWSQGVVACLAQRDAAMAGHDAITELGPDAHALREGGGSEVLFDLGFAIGHVDCCVRTADEGLLSVLRDHVGRGPFGGGAPALKAVKAASPTRVFRSKLGRIEVYQRIPGGDGAETPPGPHTHVMPRLLAHRRDAAATLPLLAGQVPALALFPPNPIRDGAGAVKPFDAGAHDAFQALMAGFAAPEIMAAKRLAWAALADGRGPGGLDLPTDRHARTALRVALRQARHTDGPSPALDAWTAAVEPAQGEAGDDADAGADHG